MYKTSTMQLDLFVLATLLGFRYVFADFVADWSLIPADRPAGSAFYSENLSIEHGAKSMSNPQLLLQAMQEDLETFSTDVLQQKLVEIRTAKKEWVGRQELLGRESILNAIGQSITTGGKLVCLLGSKSSGKTTLARHLMSKINRDSHTYRKVLLITMQHHSDFMSAVRHAIKDYNQQMQTAVLSNSTAYQKFGMELLRIVGNISFLFARRLEHDEPVQILEKDFEEKPVNVFRDLLHKFGPNCTFIIDEAQNFFSSEDHTLVLQLLHLLGNHTKVESSFSAIFLSSDVTFPESLNSLSYDVSAITTFFHAGEVNLRDTSALLQAWGFGTRAIGVIVGAYGGHLRDITDAIDHMNYYSIAEYDFNVVFSLDEMRALGSAADSVYDSMRESATTALHDLLTCLIRKGHATYDPYNPVVANFLAAQAQQQARIFAPVAPGAVVFGHADVHPKVRVMCAEELHQMYTPSGFVEVENVRTLHCKPSTDPNHRALLVVKSSYRMALARSYWGKAVNQYTIATRILERIKGGPVKQCRGGEVCSAKSPDIK